MRLINSCLWASYFITNCVAVYLAGSAHQTSLVGLPVGFISPSTHPVRFVSSRYAKPAYLADTISEGVFKNAKNIIQSIKLDRYTKVLDSVAERLSAIVPFKINLKVPFQAFVYFSNLSIFLADSFIFDGLFAGLFELRGNSIASNDEGYRIITSLFIHRDWPHLAMNLLSFSTIAPMIVKFIGPVKAMAIYLLSGIIANYITYVYHVLHDKGIYIHGEFFDGESDEYADISKKYYDAARMCKELPFPKYLLLHFKSLIRRLIFGKPKIPQINLNQIPYSFTSRGASGAIYGLHGAYMIYRWNREGVMAIPTGFFLPNRIWEIILSSILNSLGENHVDTVAHASGFISGVILGLITKLYT